jgi:hypothetical protein
MVCNKLLFTLLVFLVSLSYGGPFAVALEEQPFLEASLHSEVQEYLTNRNTDISTVISLASTNNMEPGMLLLIDFLHHDESPNTLLFFSEEDRMQKQAYLQNTLSCEIEGNTSCQIRYLQNIIAGCPKRALCPQFANADNERVSRITCAVSCSSLDYTAEELSSLYSYFSEYVSEEHLLSQDALQSGSTQGIYEFIPEFSTRIGYSFETFSTIRDEAKRLSSSCRNAQDLSSCLREELGRFNSYNGSQRLWYIDKTSPLDSLFYSYVDFLRTCAYSSRDRCNCNHTFSVSPSVQESLSLHEIRSLTLSHKTSENTTRLSFDLLGQTYRETIPFHLSQEGVAFKNRSLRLEFHFTRDGRLEGYEFQDSTSLAADEVLTVQKERMHETPILSFVDEDKKDLNQTVSCEGNNRYETFGVVDFSSQTMPFTQTLFQRTVFQPPIYSFALFFGDNEAPSLLQGIEIEDLSNASDKIVVSFDEPLDDDLAEIEVKISENGTSSFSRYVSFTDNVTTFDVINLDTPIVVPNRPLQFEAYRNDRKKTVTLSSNELYYDLTKQDYFVILDNISPREYDASLVPIDVSGNKNESLIDESRISFEAMFDMPPMPVRNLSFDQGDLRWSDVHRLVDGDSYEGDILETALPLSYEIYCTDADEKDPSSWELYTTTRALEYRFTEGKLPSRCMVLAVDRYSNSYKQYSHIETLVIT